MDFLKKIKNKSAKVGIIGLGYVGLPLGLEFALKGFNVLGFDVDQRKIPLLKKGKSYIKHISEKKIKQAVDSGKFDAVSDFGRLPEVDAIIICVPTPLNEHREPDMSYVVNTAETISKYLRKGQLVTLESTTYPGTTEEILQPLFENAPISQGVGKKKFVVGKDFYLAFSPEREDPNNPDFNTSTIPKVIGGVTPKCIKISTELYNNVIVKTVPVSSPKVAEATKLVENIYRSVNIALVNELKMVFERMDIDVWEVISAASTKPFGYNPFYPGPGLGGHCIPIDPFYLTWKAREYEVNTRFIELAGEINTYMPYYVVENAARFLNEEKKALNGAKVLILGAAYKKDIDDMRESPSLRLIELFERKGAHVDFNDPYVPKLYKMRKYNYTMKSVPVTAVNLKKYDIIVLSTDHSDYDYKFIAENSNLILDTRNAFEKHGVTAKNIKKS
ncbi:MAG: nucleotide sugar dehydrogenase [Ignavibacteriales bacterium]|nr:nucleotide sugar dehydrogenase [Ignavibacteriales bacterium]MCB9219805.1 nucleotide sugar dehydrogenase [Ignavibacteriales bacterium]